jgi:hypothetical protein
MAREACRSLIGALFVAMLRGVASAEEPAQADLSVSAAPSPPVDPTLKYDSAESETRATQDKKDSGRIFELVWANVEGGFSYINMRQLSSSNLGIENASSAGGLVGLGAGLRVFVFTFGVRARLNELSAFNFWEINGELGIHIRAKKWDPYFALHGGYTFEGSLSASAVGNSLSASATDISIHGADAGLSVGLDYYFLPVLSLGLDATGQALFLSRPPASLPPDFAQLPPAEQAMIKSQPLYQVSGDAVGFGISGSLHLGLHL